MKEEIAEILGILIGIGLVVLAWIILLGIIYLRGESVTIGSCTIF